jgi:DNA-binding ferritin-like protein
MATQEELKFNNLRTRIQTLVEERARRLGELDGLKARLLSEFKCSTVEEARTLHKQYQEQLQSLGAEVQATLTELERTVSAMEEKVHG